MKSLLYIFNFNTLNVKVSGFFNSILLLVLCGYLIAELTVRFFVPDDQYPTGHWRNNELRIRTRQLEQLNEVDIMFTGSSLCSVNIPPKMFDNMMNKNGYNTLSFNAGIRGCDYEGIAEGFKELFLPHSDPEYVVLIVSPYDLDETNEFVRSRTKSFIKTFNTPGYEALVVDLLSNSWLFGFRNEIKDFFKTGEWKYEYPLVGERGHTPMFREPNLKIPDWAISIKKSGTVSQSLINFVNFLVNKNKKVVIIEALHISGVKEQIYPEISEKFYSLINDLDKINNVMVLNVSDIIPQDEYFVDSGHLSFEGALIYGRNLAKKFIEEGFPWKKSFKINVKNE